MVLAVGSPRIKLYLIPASSAPHSYCVTLMSQFLLVETDEPMSKARVLQVPDASRNT